MSIDKAEIPKGAAWTAEAIKEIYDKNPNFKVFHRKDIAILLSEIARLSAEIEEWDLSFNLFDDAMRRGTEYYHQKHPEDSHVWPDSGKLACWLMEEITRLTEQLESWKNSRDGVLAHIEQIECEKLDLKQEVESLKTMSVAQMMYENENVRVHVIQWEERCLKAEAEITRLTTALAKKENRLTDVQQVWEIQRDQVLKLEGKLARSRELVGEAIECLKTARNDIILLTENGTDRIRALGGECDDAADTFNRLIAPIDEFIKQIAEGQG